MNPTNTRLPSVIFLFFFLIPLAHGATTEIHLFRYAKDGATILDERVVTSDWMEKNLPIQGDGVTHYYLQGPVQVSYPDPEMEEELRWNADEDTNVQENDLGAVKGTDLQDLCDLVGGMAEGEEVVIHGQDGTERTFGYENVYDYTPKQGPMIITWFQDGSSVPAYETGMRLVFFADTSWNPWGIHAFGNWDALECMEEKYLDFYYEGGERYPNTIGLSVSEISEIRIFSKAEAKSSLTVTSIPDRATIYLDGVNTETATNTTLENVEIGDHIVKVIKAGYLSSSEQVRVAGGESTVSFKLSPIPPSDVTDSGEGGWEQPLFRTSLPLVLQGQGRGQLFIDPLPGNRTILSGGQTAEFYLPSSLSPTVSVQVSHLCLFTSEGQDTATGTGMEIPLILSFDGTLLNQEVYEFHREGYDSERVFQTLCYNFSPKRFQARINHTFSVYQPGASELETTLMGAVLIRITEDNSAPGIGYWIAEGSEESVNQFDKPFIDADTLDVAVAQEIVEGTWDKVEVILLGTVEDPSLHPPSPTVWLNDRTFSLDSTNLSPHLWVSRATIPSDLFRQMTSVSIAGGKLYPEIGYAETRMVLFLGTNNKTGSGGKIDLGERGKTVPTPQRILIPTYQKDAIPLTPPQDTGIPRVQYLVTPISSSYQNLSSLLAPFWLRTMDQNSSEDETVSSTQAVCRYTQGDMIAWNTEDWQGLGEYEGRVLGSIVDVIENTSTETEILPSYVLMVHPFYRNESGTMEGGTGNQVPYPCAILDHQTEIWDEWVDLESSFLFDDTGAVIGKINKTGHYSLENGTMQEVLTCPAPTDPFEFPNALENWIRVRYEDTDEENTLSIYLNNVRVRADYNLLREDGPEKIYAQNGSTFLLVYVNVHHMGHRAYTYQYKESTPDLSAFRLFYGGFNYTPEIINGIVKTGIFQCSPYTKKILDRYEDNGGVLVFTVPEGIACDQAFLQVILPRGKTVQWQLG